MILGLSFAAFTGLHVAISLVAIGAGLVAFGAMLAGQWLSGLTLLFLATTALTAVTGFLFPFSAFGASHIVGVLTLVALAVAGYALYGSRLEGGWRSVYIASAVAALYFNGFVGLVQTFQKQPALLLSGFIGLGVMMARRFRRGVLPPV
jgi:hypothetical protein